jgi:hypothetical protein
MESKPEDKIIGLEDLGNPSAFVLDFWRWAFSDFCDDDLKGWYAEWMVSILLGFRARRRRSVANTDLVSPEGVRIEVKSSAHWQSWKINEDGTPKPFIPKDSSIRFSGLKVGNADAPEPAYQSDLYVFAFQKEKDCALWTALDLSQWEFYMLTKQQLEPVGTQSISLTKVRELCGPLMTASEFRIKGRGKLQELAAAKKAASAIAGQW